jgi:hypothetical protein
MDGEKWNKLSDINTHCIAMWFDMGQLIGVLEKKKEIEALRDIRASLDGGITIMGKMLYEGDR